MRARSSAVEHCPYKAGVDGPNPSGRTDINNQFKITN